MKFSPPWLSLRSGRATPSLRCETTTAKTNRRGFHLTNPDPCPDNPGHRLEQLKEWQNSELFFGK